MQQTRILSLLKQQHTPDLPPSSAASLTMNSARVHPFSSAANTSQGPIIQPEKSEKVKLEK
jgi:hypothetical protein